jgi:hypothetical protein
METNSSMACKDMVKMIRKARKVYKDTGNKIEAIRTVREMRPEV